MKVLVIGSEGSTGRRYCKILYEMGIEVIKHDTVLQGFSETIPEFDRAIISSPTETHYTYYCRLVHKLARIMWSELILCEKPASNIIWNSENMLCKMVNNWAFVIQNRILQPGKHLVEYYSKNHGKEGYWFDTCQLHILSNGRGCINETITGFEAYIDGEKVTREMIEQSYQRMIYSWLNRPDEIWNVHDLIPELSYIIKKHEVENERG